MHVYQLLAPAALNTKGVGAVRCATCGSTTIAGWATRSAPKPDGREPQRQKVKPYCVAHLP